MKWWHWLILELLIIFGVIAWIYFFPSEFEDNFAKVMIGFVLIYAIEKCKDINRRNRMGENYTLDRDKMPEEKNIDFCELKNLVYEITDLNESAIAVLEKENVMESMKVITVLKCNEEKMNLLLEKLEDLGV